MKAMKGRLELRVDPGRLALWRFAANTEGRTLAAFIRRAANSAAEMYAEDLIDWRQKK